MKRLFLLLFAMGIIILSPANAKIYYVGLSGMSDNSTNLPATIALATASSGVDTVYIGLGIYKLNSELFINDVIIGGCSVSGGKVTRQYPGAAGNNRNKMTVLDGNSLVLSLPSQKHRVATINKGGVIDGCLIRNGHARGTTNDPNDVSGFGGGVLINTGGKLHNSIIRGNVAMNLQHSSTNPSHGGGVYVNGGDVANCIIAFNMDDMGLGIGATHGTILNNTIARNANAPRFVLIKGTIGGTPFRHYQNTSTLTTNLEGPYIHLNDFYMAATETTFGQYACFMAAIDVASGEYSSSHGNSYMTQGDWTAMCSALTPMYGYSKITISKYLGILITQIKSPLLLTCASGPSLRYHLELNGTVGSGNEVYYPLKEASVQYAAGTSGGVAYPKDPLVRENFAMSLVNWYGSVAFSVWIGGMLPTEAQWEYAARKKRNGSVQVSATYAGGYTDANKVGWSTINTNNTTIAHEVATLLPTELGLYDMNGNRSEWCADLYDYSSVYCSGASYDPDAATGKSSSYLSTIGGATGLTASTAIHNPILAFLRNDAYWDMRRHRGGSVDMDVSFFALGRRVFSAGSVVSRTFGFRTVACVGL